MSDWILMEEALDHLKIQEHGRSVYRKKLESLRKHGKIRSSLIMGIRYYDRESLDALREKKATGKVCAVSQGSTSSQTKQENSFPTIGTSSISSEGIRDVKLRAVESARKTMRPKSSSIPGALSAKGQLQESRINS